MIVSYYNIETKKYQFNSEQRLINGLNNTNIIYENNFIDPIFDEENEIWIENASLEEIQNYKDNQKLLVEKYLIKNGVIFNGRGIDIQLDFYEFFKAKEKQYSLKGNPLFKDYIVIENGQEKNVCRITYNKIYKEISLYDITKNEFCGLFSEFEFFRENGGKSEKKIIETLDFELIPTLIYEKNPDGTNTDNLVDILWSSVKREEILYQERYKADEKMKTFNPSLYFMLTKIFDESYNRYKQTGDSSDLKNQLMNCGIQKLQEQVSDEDKIAIGLPTSYQITILEMILNALQ